MSRTLSLIIYNLLLPLGLLLMAPGALVKMRRRGGRWQDFRERLGLYPREKLAAIEALPRGRRRFWVHAVSVGEVNVALKIITRLLTLAPDRGIVLSTTTPTGYRLAEELARKHAGKIVVIYSPLDLPFVARRVLAELQPAHLVLVEAEIWPNLVTAAKKAGLPVSLANARLSKRSEGRFRLFGFFVRPVFSVLDQVLVQDQEDRERWAGLGVRHDSIHLTGSVKFDPEGRAPDEAQVAEFARLLAHVGMGGSRPVLLAASTHAGEELEIARVFERLKKKTPGLGLLLVPRHAERAAEVEMQLRQGTSLLPARRTALRTRSAETGCIIVDTTGELAAWQHLATVVIIGKSFLAEGGQNPAEALMARRPVVFGPHMENFDLLAQLLLEVRGAIRVADFTGLEEACLRLLGDPALAAQIATAGHDALAKHQGATQKTVERLLAFHR